jgi:MFS family permease
MKHRAQVVVYTAGLLQGIALVTFPAASSVFTSPQGYALSNGEYGALFVPQTVMAVVAALVGGKLGRRWGQKRVLVLGLLADLSSMTLLLASRVFLGQHLTALSLLLGATTLMGIGFGLTVPALNTLASSLFARRVDAAVLALNALLGLGTALAPVFVALFVGLGIWWGLPLAVGVLLVALLVWLVTLSLPAASAARQSRRPATCLFWLFAGFALLYGVVETMNGNWAILYMRDVFKADAGFASFALAAFWGAVTIGRMFFAGVERWLPARTTFRLLPWLIGSAFVVTALIPTSAAGLGSAVFGLAGLGCSALLPLTISLGAAEAPTSKLIACYQIGYGVAAFAVGPLHDRAGVNPRAIFGSAAVIALGLALLSVLIVRRQPARTT